MIRGCISNPPNYDVTVINNTPDSLYYQIDIYKPRIGYHYNFAYDSIAAHEKSAQQYKVAYNINQYKIAPNDTITPELRRSTWKELALKNGGLTILFYKRNLQFLSENTPITDDYIFRRIDLTPKQLDSIKYVVELKQKSPD